MKKAKKEKRFLFFHIFNGLSDSTSFKRRLFITFLFIAIPIISGIFVIAFSIIQKSSRDLAIQTQATELEKLNAQLEALLTDTETMSRELIYNSAVQDYVTKASTSSSYPDDSAVSYYINGMILNRDYINSVVLITDERTIYSTANAYTDRSSFQSICEKWWYPQMTASNASYEWFPYSTLSAKVYESQQNKEIPMQINTLMLVRPIYSTYDYQTMLGYLMIYLDDEYIENFWQNISWGKTTNVFLFDADENLLSSSSRMNDYTDILNTIPNKETNQIYKYEKESYVLASSKMTPDGWTVCMLTPYSEVNDNAKLMMTVLLCTMAGIILALFLMSKYSANNMARPVINLSHIMDAYHGTNQKPDETMVEIYQNRSDEIGQMYRSYEQLADRVNRLIQEIYVKNLEKKDAELALLQSQINPHFLYNTLDSINWIALANGQDEISDMITALSDTFRLSLMKNNSSFVEMEQEIQYIKSYLVLQKFRYADRLRYELDLPEKLPALYIPRFILQPVVENALKHGIDQLEHGGQIRICLTIGETVTIRIINDGTNIDLDKMKNLLVFHAEDNDILNFKKDGYGVQNIHRRIKIICGDDYGLSYSITSSQTICTIVLPVKTEL